MPGHGEAQGIGEGSRLVNAGVYRPYVKVIPGSPDEQTINAALAEATEAGARLASMTVFGSDDPTGRVILLFESKAESRRRVPNDTSAVGP